MEFRLLENLANSVGLKSRLLDSLENGVVESSGRSNTLHIMHKSVDKIQMLAC